MDLDPATIYARDVQAGRTPACLHIREATARHLRDLDEGRHWWDPSAMDRFRAVAQCLNVDVEDERVPMRLEPWQEFLVGSLLCWKVKDAGDPLRRRLGTRRYRYATVMTPKSAGKTPLFTVLGVYMMAADGYWCPSRRKWIPENRPKCFTIAGTIEQAIELVMKPLQEAVAESKELMRAGLAVAVGKAPDRATFTPPGEEVAAGTMLAMGSRATGLHGRVVHYVHAEELHVWRHRDHLDALTAGFKRRAQPLAVAVSNAGANRAGVAWEERQGGAAAARGDGADTHFAFICEIDEDTPRQKDERGKTLWYPAREFWPQANPSLGTICPYSYLEIEVDNAKSAADQSRVLRLNFGQWEGSDAQLVPWATWRAAESGRPDYLTAPEDHPRPKLFVGVDLGPRHDMTAACFLYRPLVGPRWAEVFFWMPDGNVTDRDAATDGYLREWAAQGHIFTPPGKTLDYRVVAEFLAKRAAGFDVKWCADPHQLDQFVASTRRFEVPFSIHGSGEPGHDMVIHPQSFAMGRPPTWALKRGADGRERGTGLWMEHSVEAVQTGILERSLMVKPSPPLRWNLGCAHVTKNENGNRRIVRPEARRRMDNIDGLMALVMASGLEALDAMVSQPNPYEDPNYTAYGHVHGMAPNQVYEGEG